MQATRDFSHYVRDLGSGLSHIDLAIDGVSCAGCMSKIERGLSALPDVTLARVNLTDRRVALEWNLANDPSFGLHTPGGCTECKGALTINGDVKRNVSYYIVAHASKFVPSGSIVMASNIPENDLPNVSFKTLGGKKVLIVLNDGATNKNFNIKYQNKVAPVSLPANCVASYVW